MTRDRNELVTAGNDNEKRNFSCPLVNLNTKKIKNMDRSDH